jgi:hypothetical protein
LTGAEKARAVIPNPYLADGPLNMHAGIIVSGRHSPQRDFLRRKPRGQRKRSNAQTVAWDYRNGQLTQRWTLSDPANQTIPKVTNFASPT